MPEQKGTLHFEASANLQRLIGRELVRTEEAALVELVKNAYDAGAQRVTIVIRPRSDKEPGEIEIRDDGHGMTLEDVRRFFMFAGYSEKADHREEDLGRVPTGEKGIGRFAADKLGKQLAVLTKARDDKHGIELVADWEAFGDKKKRFQDIIIPYKRHPISELSDVRNGTILRITRVRGQWSRERILLVRRSLSELLDPFNRPLDFEIELLVPGAPALSGPIEQTQPGPADIEVKFRVLSTGKVQRRLAGTSYPRGVAEEVATSANADALSGLKGQFLYWINRLKKDQGKGLSPGVRVYRDGFRVEPFGSPTSDWLGLAEKRAKRAGHAHVVPSRLFGFVEISRRKHPELHDTTSRQALLDNEAARGLVTLLREQLAFLEERIRIEVTEPRWKEKQTQRTVEFERARLQTLGIMSFGLAHELRQPLQTIRTEADNIVTRLKQLNIDDPEIQDAQGNIDTNIDRINKNISLIAELSRGDPGDITIFDLAQLVRDHCQALATKCAALGIDLQLSLPDSQQAKFNSTTITIILPNLVKNSIDALEGIRDRQPRITVTLTKVASKHRVQVTDNGPGIPADIKSKIFKKFATQKTGGMGVGLYHCNLMARAHGGELSFDTREGVGTTFVLEFSDK